MRSQLIRSIFVTIAVVTAGCLYTGTAAAQCGTSPRQFVNVLRSAAASKAIPTPQELKQRDEASASNFGGSIVGLWEIKFVIDGQLYDQVFDQFHADGNEVAIDIVPPVTGNVCLGRWRQISGGRYHVNHPFWIFDPETNTALVGRGLITLHFRLAPRGNYLWGTFAIQFRDLNGKQLPGFEDVEGDIVGERIG